MALMLLGTTTGLTEPAAIPPPDYSYQAMPCPEAGVPARIYWSCVDQMALFASALETARREGKLLLVTFGANWCPSCRILHSQLTGEGPANVLAPGTELGRAYHVVEIAVSLLSGGRAKSVPSGEAVMRYLAKGQPGFKARAIPFLAIADPSVEGKVFLRHVDDLAERGKPALDPKQLSGMLRAAERHIYQGEPAPAEPGWLWRQARKLLR